MPLISSTTVFFSTSLNRSLAVAFLDPMAQPQHQLQNILFEIELEIRLISEPFGDISYLSNIPSESEVYCLW